MIVLLIYLLWGEIRKREVTDFPFVLGSYCVCSGGGRRMVYIYTVCVFVRGVILLAPFEYVLYSNFYRECTIYKE